MNLISIRPTGKAIGALGRSICIATSNHSVTSVNLGATPPSNLTCMCSVLVVGVTTSTSLRDVAAYLSSTSIYLYN
uniref:Uncharacterized protein n=1 Tax=Picea sitchensis TaxID=3332 RepID=A0A6B9XRA3_PICSI|nr:hypothetical protein Q903MT_gene5706 [Picea sitchensis]